MPAPNLARTLATAICGVWLGMAGTQPAHAGEQVTTIQLRGGEIRLVNNDERKPKAVLNGKEFLFVPETVRHEATYALSDRDIVILVSDDGTIPAFDDPTIRTRVFSLTTGGAVEEFSGLDSRMTKGFVAKKKDDAVHFDLGHSKGKKVEAVLSPKGLQVSESRVLHPAFDQKTCKWLHDSILEECIYRLNKKCAAESLPPRIIYRLSDLDDHPRWAVAEKRLDAACEAACKAKKRPNYSGFAKTVCGP